MARQGTECEHLTGSDMANKQLRGETIICKDCGIGFIFTPGEQAFFDDKKLEPPKRCKHCRQVRKDEQHDNLFKNIDRMPI